MAKAFHVTLKRSEGGDDRGVVFMRRHNCPSAKHMRVAMNDEDIDQILFPVGLAGYEMPSGVPFEVKSAHPCRVCGANLRIWVTWEAPMVMASPLWVPGS